MKHYQKLAILLAGTMMGTLTMPLHASETALQTDKAADIVQLMKKDVKKATAPSLEIEVEKSGKNTYLVIEAESRYGIDAVYVNGHKAELNDDEWQYKVTKTGEYEVIAYAYNGGEAKKTQYVTIEKEPELALSQKQSAGKCYLVVKAYAEAGIEKVTVNGERISFPVKGGTRDYRITSSGKYTVIVTDKQDQTITRSWTFDLEEEMPRLELDKEVDGNQYYLIIKAAPRGGRQIETVTINGKVVAFDKDGQRIAALIRSTGNYEVVVTDTAGFKTTKSLYVKVQPVTIEKEPELLLHQTESAGKCYLVIKAYAEAGIEEVTVNGDSISFPSEGGVREYRMTSSGKYTVVVTDSYHRKITKSWTVDLKEEIPRLELSRVIEGNKCYLIISAYPQNGREIEMVEINGREIAFDEDGQRLKYFVRRTDTYEVEVTDTAGFRANEQLYINVNEAIDGPEIFLEAINSYDTSYLIIKVRDPYSNLESLTVNNHRVAINEMGGTLRYPVTVSGEYTVTAVNENGLSRSKKIYVRVNKDIHVVPPTMYRHVVIFKLNQRSWSLDGVTSMMDAATLIRNGRIYIPLRYVSNALGIENDKIKWDSRLRTAIIYDEGNVVKVTLGKKMMLVNGQEIMMDSPAIEVNGRTMVPISQVAKAFKNKGITLKWENDSKQVIITRF